MEDYFEEFDEKRSKRMELTSNEAVKQAVLAGVGQSLMPIIGVKNELLNHQIHIIPSSGLPIITKWRLVWLRKKRLSPISQAFLDFIRVEKENILSANFEWYLKF
jgi:DNA-binding transcriptional LysR family regulator